MFGTYEVLLRAQARVWPAAGEGGVGRVGQTFVAGALSSVVFWTVFLPGSSPPRLVLSRACLPAVSLSRSQPLTLPSLASARSRQRQGRPPHRRLQPGRAQVPQRPGRDRTHLRALRPGRFPILVGGFGPALARRSREGPPEEAPPVLARRRRRRRPCQRRQWPRPRPVGGRDACRWRAHALVERPPPDRPTVVGTRPSRPYLTRLSRHATVSLTPPPRPSPSPSPSSTSPRPPARPLHCPPLKLYPPRPLVSPRHHHHHTTVDRRPAAQLLAARLIERCPTRRVLADDRRLSLSLSSADASRAVCHGQGEREGRGGIRSSAGHVARGKMRRRPAARGAAGRVCECRRRAVGGGGEGGG